MVKDSRKSQRWIPRVETGVLEKKKLGGDMGGFIWRILWTGWQYFTEKESHVLLFSLFLVCLFFVFCCCFCFLGPHFWHMEVPRLGVESGIGAVPANLCHSHSNIVLSHICGPHHILWQCQILNPLSKARD